MPVCEASALEQRLIDGRANGAGQLRLRSTKRCLVFPLWPGCLACSSARSCRSLSPASRGAQEPWVKKHGKIFYRQSDLFALFYLAAAPHDLSTIRTRPFLLVPRLPYPRGGGACPPFSKWWVPPSDGIPPPPNLVAIKSFDQGQEWVRDFEGKGHIPGAEGTGRNFPSYFPLVLVSWVSEWVCAS